MSRTGGMRRSRESLESYQQGNDEEEEEEVQQQDDDDAQYDEEADEDEEDEQQGEEDEDEDEEEDEDDEANESVEQQEDGDDNEQYVENNEDEDELNDTKEVEDYQPRQQETEQPAADEEQTPPAASTASFPSFAFAPAASSSTPAAPFSFATSSTFPSSATPFSFAPSSSAASLSAFPASSTFSLSAATKAAPLGSSVTPFSFSAGSSSSSAAPTSSFTFPPIASTSAPSASSSSLPAFAFPSTATSTSAAPSTSFSFPSLFEPAATSAAAAPSFHSSAAASSTSSTSVSTTAAGSTMHVPLNTSSVSAVWSPTDDLLFYPSKPATPASAPPRNNQSAAASDLSLFRWPPIYGETSTLLHAWHAVFTSTQRQAAERAASRQRAESMEWRLAVLSQSHCYRAELEACLYRAVQSLSSTAVASELKRAGVSESEYHSHLRVLESVSSTWHLFELLYLDPHDNLTVQLTDWMQRSYLAPSLDGLAADSDEWWEAVLALLVQGRLAAVVDALHAAEAQLLQFVSADVWQQLLELVETLPSLTAHATSVTQLVSLVRDYRLAVQRLASSSAALMSHPFLPYLLAVLAGDEQAIATISPTWMQLLVARLIFSQPHTTKADIPQLVTQCIQQLDDKEKADTANTAAVDQRVSDGGKALDALREHVLCFRVHAAVLLADQMFDMPYFTAHLVDLLHHAALMPTLQEAGDDSKGKAGKRNNVAVAAQQPTAAVDKLGTMTPRDHYVQQYVQSIIAHERLWTLTPEYVQSLTTPAVQPVQALCTLLLRQPCSSYAQLSQLQGMAGRLQLPALVGQQLALRLAHHLLRSGQIGSAVAVYQRGGEEGKERVRQIARKLLFTLIRGDGAADGAAGELTTAMECVLDNVSDEWLDEERGSVDLLLLQHWADYTAIARQLNSPPPQHTKHPLQPAQLVNVFQGDQSSLLPPTEAAVAMEDGAEGEVVGVLLQDGVTLLASLLTAPLVVPSTGGAVVYTPQCFHLPLLVRLCALLQRVEAGKVGCEWSAGSVRDVLHALSRCELSWQWEEWKAEAGVRDSDVMQMRRTLLSWLQQTSTAEESAKRVSVRV